MEKNKNNAANMTGTAVGKAMENNAQHAIILQLWWIANSKCFISDAIEMF